MSKIMEGISPLPWHCYGNAIGAIDERQECCGIPDSSGECCGIPNVEWGEYQIASIGSDADAAYLTHACNLYPELVEALERADKTLNQMADTAFKVGLQGRKDWDDVAGGADLFGASDKIRAILAKCKAGAE
jgi:hypothetical protein